MAARRDHLAAAFLVPSSIIPASLNRQRIRTSRRSFCAPLLLSCTVSRHSPPQDETPPGSLPDTGCRGLKQRLLGNESACSRLRQTCSETPFEKMTKVI